MTGSLPFDAALEKTVQQFGIGPYDSSEEDEHGEDSNKREPKGKSLPDGGGGMIDAQEPMVSYPTTPTTFASVRHEDHWRGIAVDTSRVAKTEYEQWLDEKAAELQAHPSRGVNLYPYGPTPEFEALRESIRASSGVPGDADRPPRGRKPAEQTVNDTVPSVGHSNLPNDGGNPAARSDYYDRTRQGQVRAPDPKGSEIWADEDSGAYASDSLPAPTKNEVERDNELQPLGNAWSGRTVEDMSNEAGFPSTDYSENTDYDRSDLDGGGKIMASTKLATDIALVQELTTAFIKKCGKKDLTRRHVMAFLREVGKSQYFASDIIRCLKLSHKVYVKDVMDEFPVVKTASGAATIASTRDKVVDLEILHMADVETAGELRRCAASLSDVVAIAERLGVSNG